MKTIADIGEIALVERIKSFLSLPENLPVTVGDDCAVVNNVPGTELVLASDPVIENIHFISNTAPDKIGHKAVGRVLSDFAAMGAEPKWFLINLVAPADTKIKIIDEIYRGANKLLDKFNAFIIGGDVAAGDKLELHIFGTATIPVGMAVQRNGARKGDLLFVTGRLGGSIIEKHLCFEPRIGQGVWLRTRVTAMMDISDGLLLDLKRMLDMSGVGCDLLVANVPVSSDAHEIEDCKSAHEHALTDGEDFELMFTVPGEEKNRFIVDWKEEFDLECTFIGEITDESGIIKFIDSDIEIDLSGKYGYEHFVVSGK